MILDSHIKNEQSRSTSQDLYIEVDEARLRYRDEGAGPCVVFVHGWTLDLDMWELQAEALAPDHRVLRMDRRGFGLSSGLPSMSQDVLDIAVLCRHLRIERIALIGMSQGARIALQLANAALLSVSCLVLDGTPELSARRGEHGSSDLPYELYRRIARRDGMAAFRREWMEHPLAQLITQDPQAHRLLSRMIDRYAGSDLLEPRMDASSEANSAVPHGDLPPLLLINGEHDETRRRATQHLATQWSRAERVEIPGSGHLCNLDNPAAYNAALRRFLKMHAVEQAPRMRK
jgi:pimeloyl-ACP methyl ester carboxylesterase